ncbi:MAG: helix-turn-helix transcriptional regulator [Kiritimatiellia bacterium]
MKTKQIKQFAELLAWLRNARTSQKITLRTLAKTLKMPPSWVSKNETGERRLDVLEYVRFCEALGIDATKGLKLIGTGKAGKKRG